MKPVIPPRPGHLCRGGCCRGRAGAPGGGAGAAGAGRCAAQVRVLCHPFVRRSSFPGQDSAGAVPHVGFTLFSGRSPARPPGTPPRRLQLLWTDTSGSEGGGGAWSAFPRSPRRWGCRGARSRRPSWPRAGRPCGNRGVSSSLLSLLLAPSSPTRRVDAGRGSRGRARALGLEPDPPSRASPRLCGGRPARALDGDGSLAPRASRALSPLSSGEARQDQWPRVFFPHFRPLLWLNVINAPPLFKRFWSRESVSFAARPSAARAGCLLTQGRQAPRGMPRSALWLPSGEAGLVPIPVRDVSELWVVRRLLWSRWFPGWQRLTLVSV